MDEIHAVDKVNKATNFSQRSDTSENVNKKENKKTKSFYLQQFQLLVRNQIQKPNMENPFKRNIG